MYESHLDGGGGAAWHIVARLDQETSNSIDDKQYNWIQIMFIHSIHHYYQLPLIPS
jgi:hypothetical protein